MKFRFTHEAVFLCEKTDREKQFQKILFTLIAGSLIFEWSKRLQLAGSRKLFSRQQHFIDVNKSNWSKWVPIDWWVWIPRFENVSMNGNK